MRLAPLLLTAPLVLACSPEPGDELGAEESEASEGEGGGDGDGDASTSESEGDGDGDAEPPPSPAQLPTPTGECPSFTEASEVFAPAGIEPRQALVWAPDNPEPGGMLVIYWHAYGSAPEEAPFTLGQPVIDAITAAGGVVVAPRSASDSGEFPWFVVNNSPRDDDMLLGDEIVACAIEQLGVDPRRIHATGMSAGGLQTAAYAMRRSRYMASVASFSGGVFAPLEFDDPDNKFAAMIIHGGDNDLFGGFINFKDLSSIWFNQLIENAHFAFMCDHGGGHSVPSNYGADVVNFFFAHPYGTQPSPYAAGLPEGMPSDCSL